MSPQPLYFFGSLVLSAAILILIGNIGTAAVCLLTGVKFKKICLFYGKPVCTFDTPLVPITVGYIPLGGYVEIDMETFPSLPLLSRCLVPLGGPLALLLVSVACLGIGPSTHQAGAAFPQFIEFLLSPAIRGREFLTLFFEKLQASPVGAFGVLAAKAAAIHLLPFAGLPGGRILLELNGKHDKGLFAKSLIIVSVLAIPVLLVWLAIAVISFLRRG